MRASTRNYWLNLLRLIRRERMLHPLMVTYYATTRCNLNCVYCEDFGARRNAQAEPELALTDALRVLRIARQASDRLILSGGEPLLYPDIVALATRARRELGFRHITLLTNGFLLPQFEAILPALDRLVVSLDAADPKFWSEIIRAPSAVAQTILDNVRHYAAHQREWGYRLILNCVLAPDTLPGVAQVLDWCIGHNVLVSFSPQAVQNWPRYDLLVSPAYRDLLTRLVALKRQGGPILGSMTYLSTLRDMVPYPCYPTLAPRVMPNGDLVYPCRPFQREQSSHGGRPCNLLRVDSWAQALGIAAAEYGAPPRLCTTCFQQCYAEPSLMQTRPLALLWELIRYAPSRQGAVWSHVPG